jgi:hypothetical protein
LDLQQFSHSPRVHRTRVRCLEGSRLGLCLLSATQPEQRFNPDHARFLAQRAGGKLTLTLSREPERAGGISAEHRLGSADEQGLLSES